MQRNYSLENTTELKPFAWQHCELAGFSSASFYPPSGGDLHLAMSTPSVVCGVQLENTECGHSLPKKE